MFIITTVTRNNHFINWISLNKPFIIFRHVNQQHFRKIPFKSLINNRQKIDRLWTVWWLCWNIDVWWINDVTTYKLSNFNKKFLNDWRCHVCYSVNLSYFHNFIWFIRSNFNYKSIKRWVIFVLSIICLWFES